MAIIQSVNDLINRVRTILDKGDSPWMSDAEIDDFVSMAASEFTQERVDKFGATQRLRDDLGAFVRTITFIDFYNTAYWQEYLASGIANENVSIGGGQMDWGPINWLQSTPSFIGLGGEPTSFGYEVWNITYNASPISKLSCDMNFNGPFFAFGAELGQYSWGYVSAANSEENKPDINTVISIDIHYFNVSNVMNPAVSINSSGAITKTRTEPVKIISINDYQGSINDPFNVPDDNNRVAIRTGDHYHFLPDLDLSPFGFDLSTYTDSLGVPQFGGESGFGMISFNYVSGRCTTENIVNHMPKSSVEEICQIAARKILGTTADERYPIGDAEINQLNR